MTTEIQSIKTKYAERVKTKNEPGLFTYFSRMLMGFVFVLPFAMRLITAVNNPDNIATISTSTNQILFALAIVGLGIFFPNLIHVLGFMANSDN